jgi:hypothetical protein
MELSEQERQLIEIIREWSGEDDFRLGVSFQSGEWEIVLSRGAGDPNPCRGTGATFNQAWDEMAPAWARGPHLHLV